MSFLRDRAPLVGLGLLLAVVVGSGLRGVDFGYHWDEEPCQLEPLRVSIRAGVPLPDFYLYPSVNYWVNLAGLLPELVRAPFGGATGEDLIAATLAPGFLLRLRGLRIVLSALSVLWVYLAVSLWRGSRVEALLAAAILGLSWECAYHARWVAPDSLTMQFGALTLLLALRLLREPGRPAWRRLAALAAALACGTKYPGGLFLLPVITAVWLGRDRGRGPRAAAGRLLETVAVFGAGFLLTTPGALLQRARFLEDVDLMRDWYGEWGLHGYSIEPGLPHLARMIEYLGLVLLSPDAAAALILALFTLVGAAVVLGQAPRAAALLLPFPLVYLLYFSAQRVMVVRNLLVLAPFLAVLSARGLGWAAGRVGGKGLRLGLGAAVAAVLVGNGVWLVRAGESIRDRGSDRFVAALAVHLDEHPRTGFLVSPRVQERLASLDGRARPNLSSSLGPSTGAVVVYAFEAVRQPVEWPANVRRLTRAVFGPMEVNFNYYPTWLGNDRILVMSLEQAGRVRVRLLRRPR